MCTPRPRALYKILESYLAFLFHVWIYQAFPVLARILAELKLLKTNVGAITMSAGLLNDCTAWWVFWLWGTTKKKKIFSFRKHTSHHVLTLGPSCFRISYAYRVLLALVVAFLNATSTLTALWVFLCAVAWGLFIIFIVGPLFKRLCVITGSFEDGPPPFVMAILLLMVLFSAFVTDIIGVHPIFGGFLVGVIVPHDGGFAVKVTEKIEDLVNIVLLPLVSDILSWFALVYL